MPHGACTSGGTRFLCAPALRLHVFAITGLLTCKWVSTAVPCELLRAAVEVWRIFLRFALVTMTCKGSVHRTTGVVVERSQLLLRQRQTCSLVRIFDGSYSKGSP